MHNLLVEPLIRYRQSHAEMHEASLPEIFEALIADTVETFPALRPHQHHAWHAFLVQLAAAAITAEPSAKRPADEAEWAETLRRLTPDSPEDEAWHLSNTDLTKPAFMQPPARIEDYREAVDTPDELDLLVTARNHSIKRKIARNGRPEDWLFALISIQTMGGHTGRDNYGISRMTSGYGNRPSLSLSPSDKPGRQFTRDLDALLKLRTTRVHQLFPKRPVLLWDTTVARNTGRETGLGGPGPPLHRSLPASSPRSEGRDDHRPAGHVEEQKDPRRPRPDQ